METGGFFINPVHVTAIGQVKAGAQGPAAFEVFVAGGGDEGLTLRYKSADDAHQARNQLIAAVHASHR